MRGQLTNAEKQFYYRQRKKEAGEKPASGKHINRSKWRAAQFIALDGEGESYGDVESFTVGKDGKTYRAADHRYTLLAASSGESLYRGGERLDTHDCMNYLLDLGRDYPKAIFVIFAGSYDINHMLMFGFSREDIKKISKGETFEYEYEKVKYQIEYRARKSLSLKRGLSYVTNKEGNYIPKWEDKIIVWDVFGFFQEGFIGVMGKWLGKDHPHYELIKRMKGMRGDFANVEQKEINDYNAAELTSLVELMEKLHGAIDGLELVCRRWDGAGAIAASLMKKHSVLDYKQKTDAAIITAVRTAYAGGRIEICKMGYHDGAVYDYDINSAYPSVMKDCPCLQHGFWSYGKDSDVPAGFTLVHIKFDFMKGQPFYPYFFRTEKMQILFPSEGEGWYWYPEYEAGLECMGNVEVIEWYHWVPRCNHKPFSWIVDYYATRQQWTKNPTEEWQKAGEKVIKLGLNSLYGKTAQQLGGRENAPPVYHQLEWAGYITAGTRARLYKAAMRDPSAVIGFATDGIFTTRELPIECSTKKEIGMWELKTPVPKGMVIAMAGVYWWIMGDKEYTHFSRGFDKDSMKTPDLIMRAWKEGKSDIDIPMHRLIGMGTACTSDTLWEMRGRFTEGFRTLRLDGKSNKRKPCDVKKTKPHLQLVDLMPTENIEYGFGYQEISFPYPIDWLDGAMTDEFENDLELQREMGDTENI